LNATSVGFKPKEWVFNEDRKGVDFKTQELLEFSVVPVPSNPEALIEARSAGIDLGPYKEWAEQVLEDSDPGIWLPRDQVEEIVKLLSVKIPKKPSKRSADAIARITETDDPPTTQKPEKDDDKGVIPPDVSRQLTDEDVPWRRPTLTDFTDEVWTDLSATEKRRIAGHFAWAEASPPEAFGGLKLPHHRASDGWVVLRGLFAAAARLDQTQIPNADRAGVRRHLGRHYTDADLTPPWERSVNAWAAFIATKQMVEALKGSLKDETMAMLLEIFGFGQEAEAFRPVKEDPPELTEAEKAGQVLSKKNKNRIKEAVERLQAVLEEAEREEEEEEVEELAHKDELRVQDEIEEQGEDEVLLVLSDEPPGHDNKADGTEEKFDVDPDQLKEIISEALKKELTMATGKIF